VESAIKETKLILPIVISEEDWIIAQENFKRLNKGENPSEIYLEVMTEYFFSIPVSIISLI
jgi:hypothetical protein